MNEKWNDKINIFKKCNKHYAGNLWQCPEFLFLIFGFIIIAAIIITNILARNYAGPELAAILSIAITIPLLIISFSITKSFEYLAQASEMKSEFIKIMSHQLRAPLVSIKWQIESYLSKNNSDFLPEINKEQNFEKIKTSEIVIKSIQKQNEELLKLINKFLILKRIEENNFILNKEDFSILEMIFDIAKSKNILFDNDPITIKNNKEENAEVRADKEKIRIVLDNLIDNALKYSSFKKDVEICVKKAENSIKVNITDKGAGIKKEFMKNIFQKYVLPEKEYIPITSEQIPGLGIGLYLSKIIVKKHNGDIGFKTKEGEGSTFWFTLPL